MSFIRRPYSDQRQSLYEKQRAAANVAFRKKTLEANLAQRKNPPFKVGDLYAYGWGAPAGCIYEVAEFQYKTYGETNLRCVYGLKSEDPAPLRVKFRKILEAGGGKTKGVKHAWADDFGNFTKLTSKYVKQKIQSHTTAIHNWTEIAEKFKKGD